MAKIILEPGEQFEHFHSEPSKTILLKGEAKINFRNVEMPLIIQNAVEVPALASHTLVNVGMNEAVIWCSH